MAMIKHGASFENAIVEVIDPNTLCEKCGGSINLMESSNGLVECHACGHKNKVKDMDSNNA